MASGVSPEIKATIFHWWDAGGEPEEGATHFAGTAQILIGAAGEESADSFDLTMCSPTMLVEHFHPDNWNDAPVLPGGDVVPITGVWLMRTCSRPQFEAAVRRVLAAYSPGPDFASVAARIGRVIPWEYDYRYDREVNEAAGLPDTSASLWHDD